MEMVGLALTLLWKVRWENFLNRPDGSPASYGRILLRAFKEEGELEVWATEGESAKYHWVASFPIAGMSGRLGPKRKQGDLQVPEGVYRVDRFNPNSAYHLSMGLDYPNESDKVRSDPEKPGYDIFIHGNQVSAGCLAMTDPVIEKLYRVCRDSLFPDQIAVHIFPARLTKPRFKDLMMNANPPEPGLWRELERVYTAFERTHRLPVVMVQRDGAYRVVSPF